MGLGAECSAGIGLGKNRGFVDALDHAAFNPAGVVAADQVLRLIGTNILNAHEDQVRFEHAINFSGEPADGDGNRLWPAFTAELRDVDRLLSEKTRAAKRQKEGEAQPLWGWGATAAYSQGSSFLATLGFGAESLWD